MNLPPTLPSHAEKKSFYHSAATASLFAIPLAVVLNLASSAGTSQIDPEIKRTVSMMTGIFALVIIAMGIIAGIIALFGIQKHGKKGILTKALIGIILPLVLAVMAVPAMRAAHLRASQTSASSN